MSEPQEEIDFLEKQRENIRILQVALSKCKNKAEWKRCVKAWSIAFDYNEIQTKMALDQISGNIK
jgi:hypothetical protein